MFVGGRILPNARKEMAVIELDRREAARFHAAVRRCVAARPCGLAPPVVLQQSQDGLMLSAVLAETALVLRLPPAHRPHERQVIPFSSLAALDGPGAGVATLEMPANGTVHGRWQDRGAIRELDGDPVPAAQRPPQLPPVGKLQAVDASVLAALHACGQTANRAIGRPRALGRVQLRGQRGEIVGTDGGQLLLWGGFAWPFQENLLVPVVPVLGSQDLAGE
jgi:hypothetical protein